MSVTQKDHMAPLVIVVRDPDASNDIYVFDGEVETYDIDAGYADLRDESEFLEWARNHLEAAKDYAAERRKAADYIRDTVFSYAGDRHADNPNFIALAEATSYE
jgi:hypothetical protein